MTMTMIKSFFRIEKTTPGAVRYKEITQGGSDLTINEGAALGTLYVRKSAFKGDDNYPRIIAVIIDEVDLADSLGG